MSETSKARRLEELEIASNKRKAEAEKKAKDKIAKVNKEKAIMDATMDFASGQIGLWSSFLSEGTIGWAQAIPASALLAAIYALQIKVIKSQKFEAGGGLFSGKSHAQGGIDFFVEGTPGYNAEDGEYIINKRTVRKLGSKFFDFINFGNPDHVYSALSGINIDYVPTVSRSNLIMESGGQVSSSSVSGNKSFDIGILYDALLSIKEAILNQDVSFVYKGLSPLEVRSMNNLGKIEEMVL